jgi:hypothetical protein
MSLTVGPWLPGQLAHGETEEREDQRKKYGAKNKTMARKKICDA